MVLYRLETVKVMLITIRIEDGIVVGVAMVAGIGGIIIIIDGVIIIIGGVITDGIIGITMGGIIMEGVAGIIMEILIL